MRSYYEHLETAMGNPKAPIEPKPTLRSSAIFPVIHLPGITSRILFMGYWILKRNIREIAAVATLRSNKGSLLFRKNFSVTEPKTYRLELTDFLHEAGLPSDTHFIGSLEIEFFSIINLVFPYPAVVINYYGPQFSTVVHTAQRVYNDFDDMRRNSQTEVPESGFNLYADEEREPFIGLINGAEAVEDAKFSIEFFNTRHETLKQEINLGNLNPYETRMLYPAQEIPLKDFLHGKVGAGKARFHVNWIYPRLVVGNIHKGLPALSITHTYYDCTNAISDSDYWLPARPEWHPASLLVPALVTQNHFTNIYFYPIYSTTSFTVDVEIYDAAGQLRCSEQNVLFITTPSQEFYPLNLKNICLKHNILLNEELAARIIARSPDGKRLPARIKLGLDIGETSLNMPCNICTNLQPFNPPLESKPKSFRWAPLLNDQKEASVWIMNSAPNVLYTRSAEVEMTFFREKDTGTLQRKFTLPPHGFKVIYPNSDPELTSFYESSIGWFTASITNPYSSTFYFAENPSGVVGGDHGF